MDWCWKEEIRLSCSHHAVVPWQKVLRLMRSLLVNKVSDQMIIIWDRHKERLNIVNPEMTRSKNEYFYESGK